MSKHAYENGSTPVATQRGLLSLAVFALFALLAVPVAAQVPPEIMYYKFNEGSGTSTLNSAIPGAGTASQTFTTGQTWVTPGRLGPSAVAFSTAGNAWETGWATDLGTSSWTLEFWLRTNASAIGYLLGDSTAGSFRCFVQGAAGTGIRLTGPFTADIPNVVDGNWHHVAWVYDSTAGTVTRYRDGIVEGAPIAASLSISGTGPFRLGSYSSIAGSYIGDMDEFRFWRSARSASEISTWMNVEIGTATNGVVLSNQAVPASLFNTTPVTEKVMMDISASAFGTNQTISAATFTKTGTLADASINNVKLVADLDNDGQIDVGEPVLGTVASLTASKASFTFTPALPVTTTGPSRVLLAFSTSTAPTTGDTIGFEITAGTDVTWSGGTDFTSYPVQSPLITTTPPTISIGVPGTGQSVPFNFTSQGRYQTAYTAAELAGMSGGSLITELRVHGSSVTPPNFTNFKLRLAHSQTDPTIMSLTWNNFVGAQTLCINATSFTPTELPGQGAPSLWSFPLQTPFIYNGTDGLLVDWSYEGKSSTGWTVTSAVGRNRVYHTTDANAPAPTTNTTSGNYGIDFLFNTNPGNGHVLSGGPGALKLFNAVQTDTVMLDMLAVTIGAAQDLNSITVTKTGNVADAAITAVKLALDANSNGVIDTGELVGSGILTAGKIGYTFSPPLSVVPGVSRRLLVAFDTTAPLVVGDALGFEISAPADVVWASGNEFSGFPITNGPLTIELPSIQLGAVSSATTLPFNSTYYRSLNVYPASDLTGIPAGSAIREIHWLGSNLVADPTVFTNFKMLIAHSNSDPSVPLPVGYADNYADTPVTVLSAERFTPPVSGTAAPYSYIFRFDRPFIYNGTQGICIDMQWDSREFPGWSQYYVTSPTRYRVYSTSLPHAATGLSTTTTANMTGNVFFDIAPPANRAWLADHRIGARVFENAPLSNKVMLGMDATTIGAAQSISSITVNKTGSVADATISNVSLYQDSNNNGRIELGDVLLGSGTLTAGSITFSMAPAVAVAPGTPVPLLIACSTSTTLAANDTIGFEIANPAAVVWGGGQDVTGYPIAHQATVGSSLRLGAGIGNSTNTIPFNTGTSYRHLSVYSADELKDLTPGTVINAFRVFGTTATTRTFTGFELRIAHSNTDPYDTMSTTFADHWVGTQTVAIASASFTPTAVGTVGANTLWEFPFTTPFVYDGAHGISVEVMWSGSSGSGFSIHYSAGRSRLYNATITSPTGSVQAGIGSFGVEFGISTAASGVAITNGAPTPGLPTTFTDRVVLDLAAMSLGGAQSLSGFTLNKVTGSTVADAAISGIKLVNDLDNDGVVDITDTVLATGTLTGGAVSFTLPSPLAITSEVRLLVAVSAATALAPGDTFGLEITSAAGITWGGTPTDLTTFPVSGGLQPVRLSGTFTISNGNPGSAYDYGDIGTAFNDLELFGVIGSVVLEIHDNGGPFTPTDSYRLGTAAGTSTVLAPVAGLGGENSLTIRAAAGHSPVVAGSGAHNVLTTAAGTGCIAFRDIENLTVEGIEFTGGTNFGIQYYNAIVGGGQNIAIQRCKIHGISAGAAIFIHGSATTTNPGPVLIENNFFWNCEGDAGTLLTSYVKGVISTRYVASIRVRHNTFLHAPTSTGSSVFSQITSTNPIPELSYNVVHLTGAATAGVVYYRMNATTNINIPVSADRNIIHLAGGLVSMTNNTTTWDTLAQWQGAGLDTNSVTTDPLLVSSTMATANLHLTSASPAINLATTSTTATDVDGDTRAPGFADAGADERAKMRITQGTTEIRSGGTFDVGVVSTSLSQVTFTIHNDDAIGALLLTGTPDRVALTIGSNLDGTTVVQTQPVASIAPATSSNFVVNIDPATGGPFSLTLTIANDAPGQNPYVITVVGLVGPDIDLQRPVGINIPNAGTDSLAPTIYDFGTSQQVTYTISNENGGQTLNITGTSATAVSNITTVTATPPVASSVAVATSTTFAVNFTPTASGPFSFTVTVNSNDPQDPTYTITVNGTANTAPVIVVSTGAGPVTNSGTVNVTYTTTLSAQALSIQVSDLDSQNTSLTATISSQTTQGFVLAEWNSAAAGVPYTRTPTTGSFSVHSQNHLVTLTANDGQNTTVFTFTFAVSANTAPTVNLATGSTFAGSAGAGFSATVGPAPMPATLTLELFDQDNNPIDITNVSVVPSVPAGITAPAASVGNTSGSIISFGGNAGLAVPGTYTWTVTVSDNLDPPVPVDVTITVTDVSPVHQSGVNALGGNGSLTDPYFSEASLASTPTFELGLASDANAPQTLTLVSVIGDAANPSEVIDVTFTGTGPSGSINATALAPTTVADVGEHTFTVTLTDGSNNIDVTVRVVVLNSGNAQPMAGIPGGSSIMGSQTAGFTLAVGPGDALVNATIELTDSNVGDTIQVLAVTGGSQIAGVTPPAAGGPALLAWGGAANADNTPGDYVYTVTFTDNVTTPVTIELTITVLNAAPSHGAGADATGTGSAADPYTVTHEVGKGGPMAMATVSDTNTGQTLSIATVTLAPGNPTGGSGFVIALTNGVVNAIPAAVLKNRDVGVHRFTVGVTDGVTATTFELSVKVISPSSSAPASDGCVGSNSTGSLPAVLVAGLLGAAAVLRRRRAA